MRSKIFFIELLGVLTLLLIMLITVPIYKNRIPKELKKEVQNRLKQNNIEWIAVRAEGRDITLSGIAPTIELHNKAVEITKKIREVRNIYDKISPTIITPYNMSINYKKGKEFIIEGYMPSKKSIENLFQKIKRNYPKSKIIKKVDIGIGEPKNWNKLIKTLSMLLQKLDLVTINIVNKQVTLSGKCQLSSQKNKILQQLNSLKSKGFIIKQHIVAMDEPNQICQKKFNTLLSKEKIKFDEGKSIVKAKNQSLLQELVDISSLCPDAKIYIIGYTDNIGSNIENQKLSIDRAKAVMTKLFQLGVPLKRMEARGEGKSKPM
ncbi:MAG: OmpA family protein, partial [Sulfurovaceae bacterium]|nr:OmpA family protein [Sulfurovaceae bacterium]